jgi:hypothetical protein
MRLTSSRDTYHTRTLQDAADNSDPSTDDHRILPPDFISQPPYSQCADKAAAGHRSNDSTLRAGTREPCHTLVAVISEDARHGGNIQSEETAADACE